MVTIVEKIDKVSEDTIQESSQIEKEHLAVEMWNSLISGLIQARDAWETYSKETATLSSTEVVTLFPIKAQRMIARFRRSEFHILLPRLVDYYRANVGSLEELLIKEED